LFIAVLLLSQQPFFNSILPTVLSGRILVHEQFPRGWQICFFTYPIASTKQTASQLHRAAAEVEDAGRGAVGVGKLENGLPPIVALALHDDGVPEATLIFLTAPESRPVIASWQK
jgi:hypothetical protein